MAGLFPRSAGRIRREAADWRVRLADDRSPQTEAAFSRWRDSDTRNAEAFERMDRIWAASSGLAGVSGGGASARTPQGWHGLALAASLLLAVSLLVLVAVQQRWWDPRVRDPQLLVMTTPVGTVEEKSLPDGSRVTLDAASRLETRFSGSKRSVSLLEGRARFAVARDSRPFIVRAGSSEIATAGTLFDVSLYGGRATVVLIEGSVLVRHSGMPSGSTARLKAGEKLVAGVSLRPRKVEPGELAWPSGMIGFEGTSLGEAAATMNRYSNMRLRLGDRRIEELKVTGAWRAGDVEGFARSLERAFDLVLERGPNGSLLLRSRGARRPL
ncbi:MAG TPA: FecR domain-containing protein [Sphingomicrobium sp.]|nr:FecR domain-containing protein [Sphingomicrobium sp.]